MDKSIVVRKFGGYMSWGDPRIYPEVPRGAPDNDRNKSKQTNNQTNEQRNKQTIKKKKMICDR